MQIVHVMKHGVTDPSNCNEHYPSRRKDEIRQRNLALGKGDDLEITRTVCHEFPPPGHNDVSQKNDYTEKVNELEKEVIFQGLCATRVFIVRQGQGNNGQYRKNNLGGEQ